MFFQAFLDREPSSAIDARVLVNPILITIRPETASNMVCANSFHFHFLCFNLYFLG